MEKLKKDFKNIIIIVIILAIYVILMMSWLGELCPIHALFKIKCPGCGLTHATIYLLTGKFKESWNANPTCIFWWITIFSFIIDRYVKELKIKPFPTLFIIVSLLTLVVYAVKIGLGIL